jgi:hypothetical protein
VGIGLKRLLSPIVMFSISASALTPTNRIVADCAVALNVTHDSAGLMWMSALAGEGDAAAMLVANAAICR